VTSAWLTDLTVYGLAVPLLVGGLVAVWRGMGARTEVALSSAGMALLAVAPLGVVAGHWSGSGVLEWSAWELEVPLVIEAVPAGAPASPVRAETTGVNVAGETEANVFLAEPVVATTPRTVEPMVVAAVVWGAGSLVLLGCWVWAALRWRRWCRGALLPGADDRVLAV